MNLEVKKQKLNRLVNVFSENLPYYKNQKNNFNEQMTRQQYIDVFLGYWVGIFLIPMDYHLRNEKL